MRLTPAAGVPGRNQALLEFVRRLVQLRGDHAVFRRRRFFQGQAIRGVRDNRQKLLMLLKRAQAEPSMVVGGDEMTARRDPGRLADDQAAGTA
jgi:pullulanase/glycogen debranching enzyme